MRKKTTTQQAHNGGKSKTCMGRSNAQQKVKRTVKIKDTVFLAKNIRKKYIQTVDPAAKKLKKDQQQAAKSLSNKNNNIKKRTIMQKYIRDREKTGPAFDDRLIQLVRQNPAIYDVSDPAYRRVQVRVGIWENLAAELGAPSRFIQTKWKNIRYNYLQEMKCLETGTINPNIRKRRFTEDLSFLLNTAQTYQTASVVKQQNGHMNDTASLRTVPKVKDKMEQQHHSDSNNSFIYAEANTTTGSGETFEVIEIEHSDDENLINDEYSELYGLMGVANPVDSNKYVPLTPYTAPIEKTVPTSTNSLLTPLHRRPASNGVRHQQRNSVTRNERMSNITDTSANGNSSRERIVAMEVLANATKRKSMTTPHPPALTPINDPIEMYCLSLVDSLRSMSRSERERVKFEFSKILKDAKYKDE